MLRSGSVCLLTAELGLEYLARHYDGFLHFVVVDGRKLQGMEAARYVLRARAGRDELAEAAAYPGIVGALAGFALGIRQLRQGRYGEAAMWFATPGRLPVRGVRGLARGVQGSPRSFPAPSNQDDELRRVYEQLFRREDQFPGGTAEAVRRWGDQGHIMKAEQRISQIDNLLRKRTDLSDADRATALRVCNDLLAALRERGAAK